MDCREDEEPQNSNPNPNPLAINSGVLTSLLLPHLSSSLTDSVPSLNLLCHSKTDAQFTQDGRKAVWSIPYVSVAFLPSLKQNFIAYHSSKVSSRPHFIFEIHQLWQSGFSWVYSNSCCSCSFEPEIIKIGQSSHKMYNNSIVNFQESTPILNACTKKSGNLLKVPRMYPILLPRARCGTRTIFKLITAGFNSVFSFSYTGCLTKAKKKKKQKKPSLPHYLSIAGGREIHNFLKDNSTKWNVSSIVQDSNSGSRFHFLYRNVLFFFFRLKGRVIYVFYDYFSKKKKKIITRF